MPFGEVGGVCGDLVGDDPRFHIVTVGQSEVLLRRDVTEHRRAVPTNLRRADGAGNVIVTRCYVGGERPQRIERRLVALLKLQVHVLLDELHRYMTRAFDHHLNVMLPRNLRELAQGF